MNKPEWIEVEQTATDGIVVASCSVADLLSDKSISITGENGHITGTLAIPEYQRPYAWGIAQVDRLLNDIEAYTELECNHHYYLGSIILHQDEHGLLNIVDGQQRLTTLALLGYARDEYQHSLQYKAPSSHQRIAINLYHLRQRSLPQVDFARLNVTLVVTPFLDDAYRFFETQNTGGVPLTGVQVIKAIHLRAADAERRDDHARTWEAWQGLEQVVTMLMQGRYWNILKPRDFPPNNERQQLKSEVIAEFSERCGKGEDIQYHLVSDGSSNSLNVGEKRYSLRQPLNLGDNTIGYLDYFAGLYRELIIDKGGPAAFNELCETVVDNKDASPYLRTLFHGAVIAYVSQFGREHLLEGALLLFRMIYSVRVRNERTVNEQSAHSFARKSHLFDLIAHSYHHQQLIQEMRSHCYSVNADNIDEESNAKGRFIKSVKTYFNKYCSMTMSSDDFATQYDTQLMTGIKAVLRNANDQG